MDRVSLEAAVNNASANLQESAGKLDSVVGEINELHVQMRALREQLEAAQKNQVGVQVITRRTMFVQVLNRTAMHTVSPHSVEC